MTRNTLLTVVTALWMTGFVASSAQAEGSLKPGEIIISGFGFDDEPIIARVNPEPPYQFETIASVGGAIALGPRSKTLFAADSAGVSGPSTVRKIDVVSGDVTIVTEFAPPTFVIALASEPTGDLVAYVTPSQIASTGSIVRIDPNTGGQTPIILDEPQLAPGGTMSGNMVVGSDGSIYVNHGTETVRVDRATGQTAPVWPGVILQGMGRPMDIDHRTGELILCTLSPSLIIPPEAPRFMPPTIRVSPEEPSGQGQWIGPGCGNFTQSMAIEDDGGIVSAAGGALWRWKPPYDSPEELATIAYIADIAVVRAACANGLDDDNDGFIDYPEDPHCQSFSDNTERSDRCGSASIVSTTGPSGAALFVLAIVGWLRRRERTFTNDYSAS